MRTKKLENDTYTKYIEAMLETISEKGGLTGVNLRMVSKKIGCAHTNAYNYFDGYDGLIFAAYDRALVLYGLSVIKGLDEIEDGGEYFITFIKNIITFAIENPGYYRFIGSDSFDIENLSIETIQKAIELKTFFLDVFYSVTKPLLDKKEADENANILMSYIDGELFNIINKRAFPDDDTANRMIFNTIKLVKLFTFKDGHCIDLDGICEKSFKPTIPKYLINN
jgi:AcrR family transcriptional regulator